MQILAVDIGTGTQDVLLYDSRLDVENGFKLVVPSPTMIIHRRIKQATQLREPVVLTGVTMGGGPSHWAVEHHLSAGLPVYATPDAARSFNDDLEYLQSTGIILVSEDEVTSLGGKAVRLELKDYDHQAIEQAFHGFGISLGEIDLLVVGVFDHGAAPPGYSDRKFRFEYLEHRIQVRNSLSTFAFDLPDVPPIMTRLQAVANSAARTGFPVMVMDTAPAAVAGAMLDDAVQGVPQKMIVNIGNFHTLAFRLGPEGIEGVFEHHTGLLDREKLETMLNRLAAGTLTDEEVFDDHGHGARLFTRDLFNFSEQNPNLIVTGPRRNMMIDSSLPMHFAVPFGDMMLSGCFGMLSAAAEIYPDLLGEVHSSLIRSKPGGTPPWEIEIPTVLF